LAGGIFDAVVKRLGDQEPNLAGNRRAAVSVILSERATPKILLIERAESANDPWSGQVAFPGGKFQEGDASLRETAVRETREEVGIDLDASSEFLGYLGAFATHTGGMEVVPVLFLLNRPVDVATNVEVRSHMWVDLGYLASKEARTTRPVRFKGSEMQVPVFRAGSYVVWGLTHRIISSMLEGALA